MIRAITHGVTVELELHKPDKSKLLASSGVLWPEILFRPRTEILFENFSKSVKLSSETFMNEIKPLVTEEIDLENQDKLIEDALFGKVGQSVVLS